ncbi:SLOG family protein [Lentibacillus saliphilus]|uniref:SLOG family protein n=1 Tax=Lentibacillus saliphilus TaxID=2737028 RepID=UPI001C2F7461|nr:DUF1273 domain-containing protein [Lentibacillus saliphilus]
MKTITITGYKPMELNIFKEDDPRIQFIKKALEKRLIAFIEEGLEWVLISGQMGVELWAADVVMALKDEYDINVAIVPPFENQDARWPDALKEKYEEMTMLADFFQPLYKGEYKAPYQFRAKDTWLIDKSDGVLLLVDEDYPASVQYFLAIAQSTENYPIFTITPADIDDVVEEMRMSDPAYWDESY